MAELADAPDLGSGGEIREGSNPPMPTEGIPQAAPGGLPSGGDIVTS
jgi:hypothetical protein